MGTSWFRRLVRFMAGPVAVAGVIGGAMGLSAIAHADATPPAHPIVAPVSNVLGDW
jgi:hypothetical protein